MLETDLEFVRIHPCRKALAMRRERGGIERHGGDLLLRAKLDQRLTEKIECAAVAGVVKLVAVVAGDTVTRANRDYFVNGVHVGPAKSVSRQGVPLELGPTGVLPAGHYYVRAPHPDSLDSRYRLTGWVSQTQIIGRAYALF